MAERMSGTHARLRPHIKGQKSPELAKLQVEAGAIGVCTATVWEAIAMSRAGIERCVDGQRGRWPGKDRGPGQGRPRQRH